MGRGDRPTLERARTLTGERSNRAVLDLALRRLLLTFSSPAPQVLEFCHSARPPQEHTRYRELISLGFPLERAPDESLALDIQGALWNSGLVRCAGALDILIAAYAIVNDTTVLTADHDFDYIAQVSDLMHEYVAPTVWVDPTAPVPRYSQRVAQASRCSA